MHKGIALPLACVYVAPVLVAVLSLANGQLAYLYLLIKP
jgi:hypothetical protein